MICADKKDFLFLIAYILKVLAKSTLKMANVKKKLIFLVLKL
jgi:hypothetical protein